MADQIPYTLRVSSRARRLRISVLVDGAVVVTTPRFVPRLMIERFLAKHSEWVKGKVRKAEKRTIVLADKSKIPAYKKEAKKVIAERCAYYAARYGVSVKKITIRSQKSRWGSCSRKGNLNFNYQLILLPTELRDLVIVHEVCHLLEFNHSRAFWQLVGREIPDYLPLRRRLKKIAVQFGRS